MYLNEDLNELLDFNEVNKKEILKDLKEENKKKKNILKEINNMATEEYSKEKIEELSKELEWKYKYKDSTVLPTKTSVSRLKEESQEILKNKIEEKNLKEDGEVKLEELKNNQFGEINKSIKN